MISTTEFFLDVLPATGWHYVLIPKPRRDDPTKTWWLHEPSTNLDDLSMLARQRSKGKQDVYFSLASFQEESYFDERYQKTRRRTHDNVDQLKSFWLDLDCGPEKDYPSQKTAFRSLIDGCEKAGLPRPTWTVSSGNGLHIYWTLPEPVEHAAWRPTAATLETVLEWAGVQPDQSRTKDISSVLRVPGTQNWKDPSSPKPVKILDSASSGEPIDLRAFKDQLAAVVKTHNLLDKVRAKLRGRSKRSSGTANADLSAGLYPPCDPDKMASQCNVFRVMRDTQGADQDEPLWYATLGVLSRDTVTNGEQIATEWSAGFHGFDQEDLQNKLIQAREQFPGPTTCEHFRTVSGGLCEDCELTCTSPIQLGADVAHAAMDSAGIAIPPMLPGMEDDYAYRPDQGLFRKHKDEPDEHVCNAFPTIVNIFQDPDGEHWARLHTYIRTGDHPEEADLRIAAISAGGTPLLLALGGRAGVVSNNDKELGRYMKTWYDTMRKNQALGTLYRQQGWQTDGSFLLGRDVFTRTPDGDIEIRHAPLSQSLSRSASAHEPRGDLAKNVELLNQLYGRPGMEAYQFTVLAALGSTLVPLAHKGWIGLPLALWSPISGTGKTSVCKCGMSLWGDPDANGQAAYSEGATEYALYTMFGERHHIPAMVDETTNWDAKRTASFLYQTASGLAKIQGKADGGLRDNATRNWQSVVYTTANKSLISVMMSEIPNAAPMIVRVFEIRMPPVVLDPTDRTTIRALEKHHGLIGREFIQYVVKHQEQVEAALTTLIGRLQKLDGATDARFWILTAACTLLAGSIAKKLGLVDFDLKALDAFAKRQIVALRATVSESDEGIESRFTRMIAELLPQTLITDTDKSPCSIDMNFPAPRFKDIVGRYLTSDNTVYLTVKAVRRWCAASGEDYGVYRDAAKQLGSLKEHDALYRLTKGTRVGSLGNQRCWKIQFPDASILATPTSQPTNVTPMDAYR